MIDFLLHDPIVARVFYASIVAIVGLLAWRAKHHATTMLWCWLFANWGFYNACLTLIGPHREAAFTSLSDAFVCLMCAHIALKYRSAAAWSVVSLFVASTGWALICWLSHRQGGFVMYLGLNLAFMARMVVVGADAGVRLARRNSRSGDRVFDHAVG